MGVRAVTIRAATVEDIAQVMALWDAAGGPTRTPPTVEAARKLVQADPGALLLAELDGRIIGTVIVGWDGWRCHLYRLAVDPPQRRHGVAAALVKGAATRARAIGTSRIDAMVDATNDVGVAFWRASAFTLDEAERRWSLRIEP